MISYKINKEDIPTCAKEIGISQCKPIIIMVCIEILLSIYFFVVGFLFDKEEGLIYGCCLVVIFLLQTIGAIRTFFTYKRYIECQFDDLNIDEFIEYELECCNDTYIKRNLTNNTKFEFQSNEISKCFFKKNTIIVIIKTKRRIFNPKRLVYFPRLQEIADLLSKFRNNK